MHLQTPWKSLSSISLIFASQLMLAASLASFVLLAGCQKPKDESTVNQKLSDKRESIASLASEPLVSHASAITVPKEITNSTDVITVLESFTNSNGMKLVLVPAGTFAMGWPMTHEETISKSYYLGVFEVTQDEYEKVMGNNPSFFKEAKNPVEKVSWDDAVSFCKKLSELPEEKAAGREYRLPTESEWEYACRAGSTTLYSFGDSAESLGDYAWFDQNAGRKTHPVGEKKPNQWGLHDMLGNVMEWCQDDSRGSSVGSLRVSRGGGWIKRRFGMPVGVQQRGDLSVVYIQGLPRCPESVCQVAGGG